jgi:uncharacterized protein
VIRDWRPWVLVVLLVGPFLAYMGFGAFWLYQRGWGLYAFLIWVTAGAVWAYLANRWTRSRRPVLPPIDWDAPRTFSAFDLQAWHLVQEEAEKGEALSMEALTQVDVYLETGKRLATRLAAHYNPLSTDPVEHVPIVEILTALELAAEDLAELCREIPGGDMVTYAHWKRAVQYSGYFNKANEIYGYLLPIFQPLTGLVRLGTQKLMVQPAWKNMQQNVLRWFYRAFVNRLGHHLIELYSKRLSIGADQYRRLTRRRLKGAIDGEREPLVIAVAGAKDAGKSALIAALEAARAGDLGPVRSRLEQGGFEPDLADLLKSAQFVECDSYTTHPSETARDRYTRRDAVEDAVQADLLLLALDGTRDDVAADVKFLEAWSAWYAANPGLEVPPALGVLTGADRIEPSQVGVRVAAVRSALPASIAEVVPVGLASGRVTGVVDRLLPALAPLLHKAERISLIRHLHRLSTRSKARRLASQVGRQGRRLWESLRAARNPHTKVG